MLLPDDLIIKRNCSKDMIKIHKKFKGSVIASMKVKRNNVDRWGIYSIKKNCHVIVEKPLCLKIRDAKKIVQLSKQYKTNSIKYYSFI